MFFSYEIIVIFVFTGTHDIHALILGKAITDLPAFSD